MTVNEGHPNLKFVMSMRVAMRYILVCLKETKGRLEDQKSKLITEE